MYVVCGIMEFQLKIIIKKNIWNDVSKKKTIKSKKEIIIKIKQTFVASTYNEKCHKRSIYN